MGECRTFDYTFRYEVLFIYFFVKTHNYSNNILYTINELQILCFFDSINAMDMIQSEL